MTVTLCSSSATTILTISVTPATPAIDLDRPAMDICASTTAVTTPLRTPKTTKRTVRKPYPNYKVIVLDDDFNTFQHVSHCLMTYVPNMNPDRAWELTNQVHFEGAATVWTGPLEQAEFYHMQLKREGLTMAPLEAA
jgi:ATP-dependent Clp protease adaptor protein ClpS